MVIAVIWNVLQDRRRYLFASFSFILLVILIKEYYQDSYNTHIIYYTMYDEIQTYKSSLNDTIENDVTLTTLPETRLHSLCAQINTKDRSKITNANYSEIKFVTSNTEDRTVVVAVSTRDMLNRPSTQGDDVIAIWAEEKDGDGRVSGEVIDHKNGSYTGLLKLYWSGVTIIKAKLASTIINTCLKLKAIKYYGNAVFAIEPHGWGVRGSFRNKQVQEITYCGANPKIYGYIKICNFTRRNGDMPWYCGNPRSNSLSCSDIHSFGAGKFNTSFVGMEEKIQTHGHGLLPSTVTINVPENLTSSLNMSDIPCKDSAPNTSWWNKQPNGYWLNDTWHMTYCKNKVKVTFADYRKCLRGTTIIIIGDSTLRQYADFILTKIMGIKQKFKQALVGPNAPYHAMEHMFIHHGITLRYLKHEMPYHNTRGFSTIGIQSVPQLLKSFARKNMTDLVVVANYNSHMSAFPASVLRHCYRELSKAFRTLSLANPSARLFVKRPHLVIDDIRWFDPRIELLNAEILREEFSDMHDKVVLLDIWPISVAHNCNHLHPLGKPLYSQMYQLLSHLC